MLPLSTKRPWAWAIQSSSMVISQGGISFSISHRYSFSLHPILSRNSAASWGTTPLLYSKNPSGIRHRPYRGECQSFRQQVTHADGQTAVNGGAIQLLPGVIIKIVTALFCHHTEYGQKQANSLHSKNAGKVVCRATEEAVRTMCRQEKCPSGGYYVMSSSNTNQFLPASCQTIQMAGLYNAILSRWSE